MLLLAVLAGTPVSAGTVVRPLQAQARSAARGAWHWNGPAPVGRAMTIELVRGDVRIERVAGRAITVVAQRSARRADPMSVTLAVDTVGGVLRVRDVRAAAPRFGAREECLPPDLSGRGDFSRDDVRVRLVVRVPHDVHVATHVMEGEVVEAGRGRSR